MAATYVDIQHPAPLFLRTNPGLHVLIVNGTVTLFISILGLTVCSGIMVLIGVRPIHDIVAGTGVVEGADVVQGTGVVAPNSPRGFEPIMPASKAGDGESGNEERPAEQ